MLQYNFPETKRGDTFGVIRLDGVDSYQFKTNIDLTGATLKMDIRTSGVAPAPLKSWSTEGDEPMLYIDGPAEEPYEGQTVYGFHIEPAILDIQPGVHHYDIEVTFPNGSKYTFLGGTLTVINDVTK